MKYDILMMTLTSLKDYYGTLGYGQRILAAYLKEAGFGAKVFCGTNLQCGKVLREEIDGGHVSVLGLYVVQDNLPIVRNVLAWLRSKGVTSILGGPQTLAFDEAQVRELGCNYVIDGEGERPLAALMRFLVRGEGDPASIPGVRLIDGDGIYHHTPTGAPIDDLDSIPVPDELCMLRDDEQTNSYALLTGRGCPFRCAFCYEGANAKRVRMRSVENVMLEIDRRRESHPELRAIQINDDTFTLDRHRVHQFCEALKRRGLAFTCEGHVQTLYSHPEMLDEMVGSGLVDMQIGIESGSERVLRAYEKKTSPDMIRTVVERARKAGLRQMEGNFIIGGAFETQETMEESIALAEELAHIGRFMIELNAVYFSPYPLTPIANAPGAFGMRLDPERIAFSKRSMFGCVSRTDALSAEEIQAGMDAFRARLKAACLHEAERITRADIERLELQRSEMNEMLTPMWRNALKQVEHVRTFRRYGMQYHSLFNPNAMIVRSFEELRYDESGALICAAHRFAGDKRRLLERANGTHSFIAMARALDMSLNDVYRLYGGLRNLCAAYMTEY